MYLYGFKYICRAFSKPVKTCENLYTCRAKNRQITCRFPTQKDKGQALKLDHNSKLKHFAGKFKYVLLKS